ncbi:class I SAM-dependent methyltransferase [Neosynechococcus sphagnicola]|uniref:class I SAM-dependent methyltransferase n=1 Tax=Neosynechococcus sphagnicola TaxID=1501145 RepID=UPI00138DFF1B|nr:class I SAM-dependent methyltransferase [Neosynechococcus sphagnicola]
MTRIQYKLRQSGVRGLVASGLRYLANRIDPKLGHNNAGKQQTNEFLTWVRFAVPGMLGQGNVDAMEYAVANMPPGKPVLEIGSFCGLSTVVLSSLLDKHSKNNPIFTCDKWEFEGQQLGAPLGDSPSVTHDAYQAYVKSTFIRSMQTFTANRLPYTIECLSDEFFLGWFNHQKVVDVFDRPVTLGGEISFCYIDGNHTYEFAKRDFENTDKALVSGGFILFDDSADFSHWEVNQLTREIASGHQYKLVSRNPNYLFRKL